MRFISLITLMLLTACASPPCAESGQACGPTLSCCNPDESCRGVPNSLADDRICSTNTPPPRNP